ncbi:MAG: hypothetical protein HYU60_00045 [Magnetospirillum sp.]|nr:hypothetical protein [Magnetospirillum sp.]
MSRALDPAVEAATLAPVVYPALLVKLGSGDGDVLAWSGYGDLAWSGMTFKGVGYLGGISQVAETADLQANGLSFSLTGVPSELLAYAINSARQGLPAMVWFAALNEAGQLVGEPYQLWSGLTDVPEIDENPDNPTISISAENRLVDLERPRERRYTPEDQKLDDPTDKGFDFVAGLQDREVIFGRS